MTKSANLFARRKGLRIKNLPVWAEQEEYRDEKNKKEALFPRSGILPNHPKS